MKPFIILAVALTTNAAFARFQLERVQVTGDKEAHLEFLGTGSIPVPNQSVQDGIIELTFQGGEISEVSQGKLDLEAPHVLVRRVSVFSPENGVVKAKIVVNGSSDSLKDRFTYSRTEKGIQANIAYPKNESAALTLFKEEQEPIKDFKTVGKAETAKMPYFQFLLVVCVILAAGGATFVILRLLKRKGIISGSRKYLIEQLSHVALSQKAGVSLLKVGKEFVLVGVTAEQVTFLSNLPRLQEQYDDETRFERGAFRAAVEEEVDRMRAATA